MVRVAIAFSWLLIASVSCEVVYEVSVHDGLEHMSLEGETYLNLANTPVVECFIHCVHDCLCMAFEMFDENTGSTECQLLASTRSQKPSKLIPMQGCTYFDITRSPKNQISRCTEGINCCLMSQPCLNGATCRPASISERNTTRFRCICAPRYGGTRCQYPTSCRGYDNGKNKNGLYKIIRDTNTQDIFTVFCDFNEDGGKPWTLVSSYALRNVAEFRKAFFFDKPVNENNVSWSRYRLSKTRMESIQRNSTKWRMTCNFLTTTSSITKTDYVRVSMANVNPVTFDAGICVQVETIAVRGYNCSDCTAPLIQTNVWPLHFDCNPASWGLCDFKPANPRGCTEDNFGLYNCANPLHRCAASPGSTTQIWFGD